MILDVQLWLEDLGLEDYGEAFARNDVDGELLPRLTGEELREIGVHSVGHRRRLLEAIRELAAVAPSTVVEDDDSATASRRQVTVLFADISGFTEMSGRHDAEEVHARLNAFFAAADEIVADHGGRIDKHIGDAVMAVFGAPVAHTDDPERALRAARAIHEAVSRLEPPLDVHVGVASGQVLASSTGSAAHVEYTVTGESVNLADRLTDQAAPGETLVSPAVRRALGDRFIGANLGPREIQGLATPIAVWRLDAIATPADQNPHSFVGRAREKRLFTNAMDGCLESGTGETLVLRGEAGIGKTRLLAEFVEHARRRDVAVYTSLVLDFGAAKGQDVMPALVRSLLGLTQGGGEAERADAASEAIGAGLVAEEDRSHLNYLLDLPQPEDLEQLYQAMDNEARTRGRRGVVAALIRARAEERPLVLAIEDIHWSTPEVLPYLAQIVTCVAECPALLLMTTRIEGDPLDEVRRAAGRGTVVMTVDLGPLRAEEAARLARVFGADERVAETCVARAGGNPLFLEQLVRNADEVGEEDIPGTLQGIVQARLDVIPRADRQAIRAAAILGQRFGLDALAFLLGVRDYDPSNLLRAALIRPAGPNFHFAHALIRDATYESIVRPLRAELHVRAAEWFHDLDPTLHAEHLLMADDRRAADAFLRAARHDAETFRVDQALSLIDRALVLDCEPATSFELICLDGDLLAATGRSAEALDVFGEATAMARGDEAVVRAHFGHAQAARLASLHEAALQSLEVAEAAANRLDATGDIANIHYIRGNIYFPLGRIDDCLESCELAIGAARRAGSNRLLVGALSNFGDANYLRGRMATARDDYTRAIDLARAHGLPRDLAANLHNRGPAHLFCGNLADAVTDCEESARLARRLSIPLTEAVALGCMTWALIQRDELERAEEAIGRSHELSLRIGARRFEGWFQSVFARVRFFLGDREGARRLAGAAVETALAHSRHFAAPKCLSLLARLTDDAGEQTRLLEQGAEILGRGMCRPQSLLLLSRRHGGHAAPAALGRD